MCKGDLDISQEKQTFWDDRYYNHEKRPDDVRKSHEIDMARIIHSAAFRRLQGKTQILGLNDSDFYRTRLTHSIEVAQVAVGILRYMGRPGNSNKSNSIQFPEASQLTAISLAHDIGHPPFGHGGEIALNFMMRNDGGFEGNAQTLRLLSYLEPRSKQWHGLNLTRRTLLGILKYPGKYTELKRTKDPEFPSSNVFRQLKIDDWKPPKCYYNEEVEIVDWILKQFPKNDRQLFQTNDRDKHNDPEKHKKTRYKFLDTSIMDLADDISYGVHDLEDAIHLGFITKADWDDKAKKCLETVSKKWVEESKLEGIENKLFGEPAERKDAIGQLVYIFITNCELEEISPDFTNEMLKYNVCHKNNSDAKNFLKCLKNLVSEKVIKSPTVRTLEYRGLQIVMELFEAFIANPERLLPEKIKKLIDENKVSPQRVITDYIAGMTDEFATKMYERLFVPREGTVFQKI